MIDAQGRERSLREMRQREWKSSGEGTLGQQWEKREKKYQSDSSRKANFPKVCLIKYRRPHLSWSPPNQGVQTLPPPPRNLPMGAIALNHTVSPYKGSCGGQFRCRHLLCEFLMSGEVNPKASRRGESHQHGTFADRSSHMAKLLLSLNSFLSSPPTIDI